MIRDVVIHMTNEQPLQADLRALPTSRDSCLVCTNIRLVGGKKPTFIDEIESWFLIPFHVVRFVEVPQKSIAASEDGADMLALPSGPASDDGDGFAIDDLEADEDLLRRIREA